MSIKISPVIILFCILALTTPALPHENVTIDNSLDKVSIGLYLEYLEDKEGNLTIEDLTKSEDKYKWTNAEKQNPGFGFTDSVYWVRFTVKNITLTEIQFYLEQGYPLIDDFKVFIPAGFKKYNIVDVGDLKLFSQRPYKHRTFVIPLELKAKTSSVIYIRQKTESSMSFVLTLWSRASLDEMVMQENRILMIYYGVMMVMVLYNLFIFFFVRRKEYLYFILFVIFFLLFVMTQNGTAFQFLWPDSPWFANWFIPISLSLLVLFAYLFSRDFLEMEKNFFIFHKVVNYFLMPLTIILLILCTFLKYRYAMVLSTANTIIALIFGLTSGIVFSLKKIRSAYFYLSSWLIFLSGSLMYALMTFGLLPANFLTIWLVQIGSAAKVILLSIALADRINIMRNEMQSLNITLENNIDELETLFRSSNLILQEKEIKIILNTLIKPLPFIYIFLFEKNQEQYRMIEYGFDPGKVFAVDEVKKFLPVLENYLESNQKPEYSEFYDFIIANVGPEYLDNFSLEKDMELGKTICLSTIKNLHYSPDNLQEEANLKLFLNQSNSIASTHVLITLLLYNRALREELISEERLSALGRTAATLIHDIKNPLSIIKGYAEYLTDSDLDKNEKEEYIKAIDEEMNGIIAMTREVLDFSKDQIILEKTSRDFSEFLQGLVNENQKIFQENHIQCSLKLNTHAELSLDYNRMKRVFINLIKNSLDVLQPQTGAINISFYQEDNSFIAEISDNGPGIPDEIRQNLFEPFVTYGKHTGTGLGTAIAKKVVEEHGGKIWFKSEYGKGTSFFIQLPNEH